MSLVNLTSEEMVRVSGLWVTPPGMKLPTGEDIPTVRPVLEGIELLAPMVPVLSEAHDLLKNLAKEEAGLPPPVQEIIKKQRLIDPRFDSLCRLVFKVMDALEEFIEEPAPRERLGALKRKLFPYGLAMINWTYSREAGAAQRLEGRLNNEDRTLLAQIKLSYQAHVPDSFLLLVEELIEKGKQLGVLEDQKSALLKQLAAGTSAPNERDLRNQWVGAVATLRQLVKLAKLSPEVEAQILGGLYDAEKIADARNAPAEPVEPPK
jgi:hypothetical protein